MGRHVGQLDSAAEQRAHFQSRICSRCSPIGRIGLHAQAIRAHVPDFSTGSASPSARTTSRDALRAGAAITRRDTATCRLAARQGAVEQEASVLVCMAMGALSERGRRADAGGVAQLGCDRQCG